MSPEEAVQAAKDDLRRLREEWYRIGSETGLTYEQAESYRNQTRAARERFLAAKSRLREPA